MSSYVDLSILYGSSDEDVDSVRRKDGTEMLWDDVLRTTGCDSCLLSRPF
jgi:hypothetical protein